MLKKIFQLKYPAQEYIHIDTKRQLEYNRTDCSGHIYMNIAYKFLIIPNLCLCVCVLSLCALCVECLDQLHTLP